MRNIKFRGKEEERGWIYGSLNRDNPQNCWYITDNETGTGIEVEEETIGQYTGLKDKNGVEIYEGDIVKTVTEEICVVEYRYNAFGLKVIDNSKPYGWVDFINHNIEIIGNIYDNPELLENFVKQYFERLCEDVKNKR